MTNDHMAMPADRAEQCAGRFPALTQPRVDRATCAAVAEVHCPGFVAFAAHGELVRAARVSLKLKSACFIAAQAAAVEQGKQCRIAHRAETALLLAGLEQRGDFCER